MGDDIGAKPFGSLRGCGKGCELGGRIEEQTKGQTSCLPFRGNPLRYFRFVIAVRSNLPVTTNVEPHQVEPKPSGLIAVKLPVNVAVWSLVNALQSPLFRSVSYQRKSSVKTLFVKAKPTFQVV